MRIVLDATVMEQESTGIAKSTLGLYEACLRKMPSLAITAVHRNLLASKLQPELTSMRVGARFPAKAWRPVVLPSYVAMNRNSIIHFPWNGNVPWHIHADLVVSTIHDVLPLVIPGFFASVSAEHDYRHSLQRSMNRSDLLLTDSEYSRSEIIKNFKVSTEPTVLYIATSLIDSGGFRGGAHEGPGYFLYVGGYDRRKGMEELLKVFMTLHRERAISSRLVIVGKKRLISKSFDQLLKEANALGLVEEKGYVTDDVLQSLYANAIALVYLSRYEGFGLPPLEAMAMGCPVIATRGTSIPEVCGEAAYYVDPDNEKECAQALVRLEREPGLRKKLEDEGRKRAGMFSWEKSADTFLDILVSRTESPNNPNRKADVDEA